MSHVSRARLAALLVTLSVSIVPFTSALAASPCKGMAQPVCQADAQCAWVDGYTRKDGRAVASHCKRKPVKQSAKKTPEQPRVSQLN